MRLTSSALALLALAASPLHGQSSRISASDLPTCASLGTPRLAVLLPPGADSAKARASLQASDAIPDGYDVRIIDRRRAPGFAGAGTADRDIGRLLRRLSDQNMQVRGDAISLVSLDSDGVVDSVIPGSGDTEVDRAIRLYWRDQRFTPVVVDGCRAPAWIHIPIRFEIHATRVFARVGYGAVDPA